MESNCCGAEPSYISDELCGECLEWAEFKETDTVKCEMCNYENHIDNFCCGGEDCGIPLDLEITENSFGLPEIKQKNIC